MRPNTIKYDNNYNDSGCDRTVQVAVTEWLASLTAV